MKTFLTSIVISVACVSMASGADISPEALEAIKGFAAKQETAMSNLKSFDMSGTIRIVQTDEQVKVQNPPSPKVTQHRFRIIAGPNDIKETIERLDDAGKVIQTEVYYLDKKRVVWVNDYNGFSIKPFVLAERKNNGLFNICPAFFQDSFLNLDITSAGIPALLVPDLGSKEKWMKVVESLQAAQVGSDGHVYATIAGTEGHSTIELVKQPNSTNDYQVASLSFFADIAKDVTIQRKIDVLDVSNDQNFGTVGKTFKMNIYLASFEVPQFTWEYTITDMKVNCPIDAEALQFDPLAVKNIDDAEKGCYVTASK